MRALVSLEMIKRLQGFDDSVEDSRLRQMIEAVSRDVLGYTKREAFGGGVTATRYLSGNGRDCLLLPWDVISVTSLKEDADGDAVYEATWASTDYVLAPYANDPTGPADLDMTRPFWQLEVDERSTGTKSYFARGQKRFELTAKFGYNESPRDSGATLDGALNASATSVTVDDGSLVESLQTVLVDSEQLYVTNVNGTTLTVERGANGTTAASHDSGSTVNVLEAPGPIREAVTINVQRRWQMERGAYAREVGFPETGQVQTFGGVSLFVPRELESFRKLTVH